MDTEQWKEFVNGKKGGKVGGCLIQTQQNEEVDYTVATHAATGFLVELNLKQTVLSHSLLVVESQA